MRRELLELAPWYFDIEVTDGLRTSLYLDAPEREGTEKIAVQIVNQVDGTRIQREAFVPEERAVGAQPHMSLLDPRHDFLNTLKGIYPGGLAGRSVLDCACNAGAYLFWAKEVGAGKCFGFDLRDQWIEQAKFLAKYRDGRTDDMSFEVSNLYDLPALRLGTFEWCCSTGSSTTCPTRSRGLRIAADLAGEVLILDTATRRGTSEGALVATPQPKTRSISGVYGLRWLPVGPEVLFRVLEWMGFAEVRCTWWRPRGPVRDRIEVVAGRNEGSLDSLDAAAGGPEDRIRSIIATSVPPDTDVLVASAGNDALLDLEGRRGWHFPQAADGTHAPDLTGDVDGAIAQLERLREAGADYLAVPVEVPSGFESAPDLLERLVQRFRVARRGPACRIFELTERERSRFRPQSA